MEKKKFRNSPHNNLSKKRNGRQEEEKKAGLL
jgi:hypothetical protein